MAKEMTSQRPMASASDSILSRHAERAVLLNKRKIKKTTILLCMAVEHWDAPHTHHDERRGLGNGSRPSALTLPRNAIATRGRRFQIVDLTGEPSER